MEQIIKNSVQRIIKKYKRMRGCRLRGNMTLEAAIIVPFIMIILLMTVQSGVSMYSAVKESASEYTADIEKSAAGTSEKRKSLYEYRLIKEEISKVLE